jgi:hypothetical protein
MEEGRRGEWKLEREDREKKVNKEGNKEEREKGRGGGKGGKMRTEGK